MRLIIILCILLSTPVYANNTYINQCTGCHKKDGSGIAGYSPRLAGQHWQYLRDQIRDIKLGRRTNGMSFVMQTLFEPLNAKQIDELSKYMQGLK